MWQTASWQYLLLVQQRKSSKRSSDVFWVWNGWMVWVFFWWVAGEEEGDRNVTLVYQAPCMQTVITADRALLTASDSGSTRLDKQHASPLYFGLSIQSQPSCWSIATLWKQRNTVNFKGCLSSIGGWKFEQGMKWEGFLLPRNGPCFILVC